MQNGLKIVFRVILQNDTKVVFRAVSDRVFSDIPKYNQVLSRELAKQDDFAEDHFNICNQAYE